MHEYDCTTRGGHKNVAADPHGEWDPHTREPIPPLTQWVKSSQGLAQSDDQAAGKFSHTGQCEPGIPATQA
jgi:hypothetical protein